MAGDKILTMDEKVLLRVMVIKIRAGNMRKLVL